MRQYELTYLISDNVSEGDLNKVTGKVDGYLRELGGKLLKEEVWGRRKLAYPIAKQEFATYVTIIFELDAEKANSFEHNIKMTGKIIRHLMIVKKYEEEALTLTAEDIAETKEIEEVVGGEKSFEAVEGETEESKELMSVRDKEKVEEVEAEAEENVEDTANAKEEPVKEVEAAPEKTEEVSEKEEKKTASKAKTKKTPAKTTKKEKTEDEADRLSKLDKELDDILGDDL